MVLFPCYSAFLEGQRQLLATQIAQGEYLAVEVSHEDFRLLFALLGFGNDCLLRPNALYVVVSVQLIHEVVAGVFCLSVAVGEHPLEVAEVEQIAEFLQPHLLFVAPFAWFCLVCRTVGRVEEEERVAAEAAAKKLNAMGMPRVGLDMIDGKIIEINVTSPCYFINEINNLYNINFEKKLMPEIYKISGLYSYAAISL